MDQGSEILTAYVMSLIHESGWTIPAEIQQKIQDSLTSLIRQTSLIALGALEDIQRLASTDGRLEEAFLRLTQEA